MHVVNTHTHMYCVHNACVYDGGIGFCRKPDTRRRASGREMCGNAFIVMWPTTHNNRIIIIVIARINIIILPPAAQ